MAPPGTDPGFVGPEPYTILGALFSKRTQNYKHKTRYRSEYLLRSLPRVWKRPMRMRSPEA